MNLIEFTTKIGESESNVNKESKSYNNKNSGVGVGVIRLFNHISRVISTSLYDEGSKGLTDRKLKRKIDEKKLAQGIKQGKNTPAGSSAGVGKKILCML